jgi:hypothetical protein
VELTQFEKDFAARAAVHFRRGATVEQAMRAVLEDDRRILETLQRNAAARNDIVGRMAESIWHQVRARDHAERAAAAWPKARPVRVATDV